MKVVQFKALIKAAYDTKKPVNSLLYWKDDKGQYYLKRDYGERIITICQTNSFALATQQSVKDEETGNEVAATVNSWCDYPRASELQELSFNMELYSAVAQITFEFGKVIYYFNK